MRTVLSTRGPFSDLRGTLQRSPVLAPGVTAHKPLSWTSCGCSETSQVASKTTAPTHPAPPPAAPPHHHPAASSLPAPPARSAPLHVTPKLPLRPQALFQRTHGFMDSVTPLPQVPSPALGPAQCSRGPGTIKHSEGVWYELDEGPE